MKAFSHKLANAGFDEQSFADQVQRIDYDYDNNDHLFGDQSSLVYIRAPPSERSSDGTCLFSAPIPALEWVALGFVFRHVADRERRSRVLGGEFYDSPPRSFAIIAPEDAWRAVLKPSATAFASTAVKPARGRSKAM